MAIKYTEEQLNNVDKSFLVQMFLNQQEEMAKATNQVELLTNEVQSLNKKMQTLMEQLVLSKILYEYQLTRNASHPQEFLKEFKGIYVTDGYQVYHTLEKEKEDLTIAGCWVHMRRRFEQAWEVIPKEARKGTISYMAMKQIQAIYREEGKLKELHSKERLEQQQAIIKPLVDAFFVYLKQNQTEVYGSGKLHDAFTYALNQEKYLKVFLEDGEVPIDNNASERAIRGFCVGKKNWHMIDTINGAKTSAMIYSIAETAKANNLKPYDYFEHLLEEIPKHMEDTDRSFLKELLPWSDKLPKHIRK